MLIPKKDGSFRPIMVLNNPLRYLEKGILETLRKSSYRNDDDIFGFRTSRSTHDAYAEVKNILLTEKDTKITFLDFSKAYNTVDRALLLKIMKIKLDPETFKCVEKIVNNQNVEITNRFISCEAGVPQGSSISPLLFNHYVDSLITVLKKRMPGLGRVISYADDLALIGEVDYKVLVRITKEFSLKLNPKKSATFNWRTREIPERKTYMYLGTRLKSDGTTYGKSRVLEKMRTVA